MVRQILQSTAKKTAVGADTRQDATYATVSQDNRTGRVEDFTSQSRYNLNYFTFPEDLGGKVKSRITELAKTVDADLAKDTGRRILKDLTISGETNAGKIIKQNIVSKALDQLEELYTKIGDTVGSANIKEARKIAMKDGLTNLEINDLARVYGEEFGSKAFNKVGDALTSVNAQMYENTRKGLKSLARQGLS